MNQGMGEAASGCGAANLGDANDRLVHGVSFIAVQVLLFRAWRRLRNATHMGDSRSKISVEVARSL